MTQDQKSHNPFDSMARRVKELHIPMSKENLPMVPGECNEPQCWIDNMAEGFSSDGGYTKEQAAGEIRSAFERKYGMSPEKAQKLARPETPEEKQVKAQAYKDKVQNRVEESRQHLHRNPHEVKQDNIPEPVRFFDAKTNWEHRPRRSKSKDRELDR